MKKYVFILLAFSLEFLSCSVDSTDIYEEKKGQTNKTIETRAVVPEKFDWETADWMPTPPGQSQISVPWVGQGALALNYGTDVLEDKLERGGWELIFSTFSKEAPGPLQNPYFILYNKYRGLLRIFLYTTTPFISPSSYIEDRLFINTNIQTRLFDFLLSDVINPSKHTNIFRQIQPAPFDGSSPLATNRWYMMQYELAYDPNIAKIPYNQIQLVWNLNYCNIEKISMGGEVQAKVNGMIGDAGGSDWITDVKDATIHTGTGILSGIGVSFWEKNKKADGGNKLGLNNTVFKQIGKGLESAVSAVSKGFFGDIVNIFSAVIGTGQVAPTPINMSLVGNVELKGDFTSQGSLPGMPISFWMPGTDISAQAQGYLPLYNKPLGVINFKYSPHIEYYPHKTYRTFIEDSLPGGEMLVKETCESISIHTEGCFEDCLMINPEIEKIADVEIIEQQVLNHGQRAKQVYQRITYDAPYLKGIDELSNLDFSVRFVIKVTPKNGGDVSYIIKTLDLIEPKTLGF